jgi:hypothetical protein
MLVMQVCVSITYLTQLAQQDTKSCIGRWWWVQSACPFFLLLGEGVGSERVWSVCLFRLGPLFVLSAGRVASKEDHDMVW